MCVLPYVKGTPDKLGKICRKVEVHPVFQQKRTLRSLLTRVKGPQKHVDKGVVYQIPCAQCDEVYVGETGRPLKTRITEHKRAVSTGDVRNANAVHCMKTNHSMDWNAAVVVVHQSMYYNIIAALLCVCMNNIINNHICPCKLLGNVPSPFVQTAHALQFHGRM